MKGYIYISFVSSFNNVLLKIYLKKFFLEIYAQY